MRHILTLGALICILVGVCNLAQPSENLSIVSLGLSAVGAIYLIVMMLKGKLKGGSN